MQTANYLNLDILFHRDGDHYRVRARNSVGSESSRVQSFMVPFSPQEREMLTGAMPDPGHLNVTPQQVGQRLYEALFQGEVRDLLVRSHEQARTLAGLRLRLHLNDTAELALLPWEYLYDAKEARFLALTARLSIVRYLALGEPPQALQVDPPLRVLVVLANPTDIFPQLDVEAEWQQLQTVLAPLVDQGIIELIRLPRPTRNALADHLEQYPVHVLHFVGHGNGDAASGEGGLYLVNEAGAADFVPASVLQVLLADTRDRRNALRLAFLNGCLTGRSAQVDPFAGTAQQLVQHGVPAVIAMQYSVTDGAATELAHRFYRALARSYPVDAALAQARKGVYIQGNYLEWGTPVLFLRAPDGQLFTVAGAEKLSPLLPDVECPYRGLEVFEAEHAHLYFGRENMIQRLLAKVAKTNFIAVVGPSGSGKSSLVRAGLIPALAKGALTGSAQWAVATLRPGSDPVRSMISALLQVGDPQTDYASRIAEVRRLANMLMVEELPLADLLDPLHEHHPGLVLVVDQFEEAFTLCSDLQARDRFFAALLAAAAQDWIKVILTLRADFWGHVLDDKQLDKPADAGQVNVLVMTRAERRAAIEQPAHAVGRRFEEGLVSLILDELEAEPGELPLLEFALTELWARQSVDGVLTHAAYEDIGKVSGAIARRADETVQRLDERERHQVRTLFTRLVRVARPEEGDQDTKRRIALAELDAETQAQVQRLASARLLVTGTDPDTSQPTVEIAHEALIRSWQELKDWLNRDREFLLWRQRLRTLRESWQRSYEDSDVLLRGALLAEAELQAQNRPSDLDEQERTYIVASRQAENGRMQIEVDARRHELAQAQQLAAEQAKRVTAESNRTRTFRVATIIVSIFLLLAVGAAGWAVDRQWAAQNNAATAQAESTRADQEASAANIARVTSDANAANAQTQASIAATRAAEAQVAQAQAETVARLAQSRALAATSQSAINIEPMRAWLLAIEAGRVADTEQAFKAINEQDQLISRPLMTLIHNSDIRDVEWNKDGTRIISLSTDNTMQIWNAKSGSLIRSIASNYNINSVQLNGNGTRILSWGSDKHISVLEATSGDLQLTLLHDNNVSGAQWNEDGSQILSWRSDNIINIWDANTGDMVLNQKLEGNVLSVRSSKDKTQFLYQTVEGIIGIWDTTDNLNRIIANDMQIEGAQWNRDGTNVLYWGKDESGEIGNIRVRNTVSGDLRLTIPDGNAVHNAQWNRDETRILSYSQNNSTLTDNIHIFDATDGKLLLTISNYDVIDGVQWNRDGTQILSRSWDKLRETVEVSIWDVASGDLLLTLPHMLPVWGAKWDNNESQILTWDESYIIRIWSASAIDLLPSLAHDSDIGGMKWNSTESQILSWSSDNTIRIWDAENGNLQHTLPHGHSIWNALWNKSETTILSLSGDLYDDTSYIDIWDVASEKRLRTYTHKGRFNGMQWSRDESKILTWSPDGTIQIWGVDSETPSRSFTYAGSVLGAKWNANESQILSWNSEETGENSHILIWKVTNDAPIHILDQIGMVTGVQWNKNESQILSWSGYPDNNSGDIRLWNTASGEMLFPPLTHNSFWVNGAQWSRNERRILSWGGDGMVYLWDASNGQELLPLPHGGNVLGAQWNEDETRVLSWGEDANIKIWDVAHNQLLRSLSQNDTIWGAQWSKDGSKILSWSRSGDVKLWDLQTGLAIQSFIGSTSSTPKWNQAEAQIMLDAEDGRINRYYTRMADLLVAACTRATRNLTWQEWQQYLSGEPYRQTCPNLPVHPSVPESVQVSNKDDLSQPSQSDYPVHNINHFLTRK